MNLTAPSVAYFDFQAICFEEPCILKATTNTDFLPLTNVPDVVRSCLTSGLDL